MRSFTNPYGHSLSGVCTVFSTGEAGEKLESRLTANGTAESPSKTPAEHAYFSQKFIPSNAQSWRAAVARVRFLLFRFVGPNSVALRFTLPSSTIRLLQVLEPFSVLALLII